MHKLLLVLLIVGVLIGCEDAPPPVPLTPEQVATNTTRLGKCQGAIAEAIHRRVLYSVDKLPHYVEVGPTWYDLPLTEKRAVAALVNCVAVGGADRHVGYALLDYKNGKAVAYYVVVGDDGVLDLQ